MSTVLSEESGLCPQAEDGFQELESHPRDREQSPISPAAWQCADRPRVSAGTAEQGHGLDAISEP